MRITGLHHVQITVPLGREAEARAFYCGLLGLPETPKPASLRGRRGLWLRVGDRDVHVGVEDGADRGRTKAHVAYRVSDLAGWRKLLVERGVEVFGGAPIPGFDRFEFRDPPSATVSSSSRRRGRQHRAVEAESRRRAPAVGGPRPHAQARHERGRAAARPLRRVRDCCALGASRPRGAWTATATAPCAWPRSWASRPWVSDST